MGTALERIIGDRHILIGFASHRGEFQARGLNEGKPDTSVVENVTVGPAKPGSVDSLLSDVGPPLFALDLRKLRGGLTPRRGFAGSF
ncbi:erythromycin esterase family protein [Singulisphaera sp. GP187]|uniref:erythromycin esterase family protein n=1 Tax=Singulisphaera sp. GP187 TaxID=1882752 RepID=UPI000940D84D